MRLQLLVPVFVSLATATAHAQAVPASTAAADDSGPHAGSWSFEVNLPVDATFAPNQTLIGVGGVELGLGQRLTDRWYLGVTGGIEGLVGTNFEATNTPSMRLRGGVEARYTFHQGSGTVSVNDGPEFGVPRYDWIGANAGLESLDGGTTHGEYAELTLGSDVWLGRTQVGMYLKAGVSIEPNGAYGSVPMTNDDGATEAVEAPPAQDVSSTTATYVALGWRLAFG
jgi:opacity protein-like surface antigen